MKDEKTFEEVVENVKKADTEGIKVTIKAKNGRKFVSDDR